MYLVQLRITLLLLPVLWSPAAAAPALPTAAKARCGVSDLRSGATLDPSATDAKGASVKYIKSIVVAGDNKKLACAQACCDEADCDLGVYELVKEQPGAEKVIPKNCFLLSCQPFDLCVFRNTSDMNSLAIVTRVPIPVDAPNKGVSTVTHHIIARSVSMETAGQTETTTQIETTSTPTSVSSTGSTTVDTTTADNAAHTTIVSISEPITTPLDSTTVTTTLAADTTTTTSSSIATTTVILEVTSATTAQTTTQTLNATESIPNSSSAATTTTLSATTVTTSDSVTSHVDAHETSMSMAETSMSMAETSMSMAETSMSMAEPSTVKDDSASTKHQPHEQTSLPPNHSLDTSKQSTASSAEGSVSTNLPKKPGVTSTQDLGGAGGEQDLLMSQSSSFMPSGRATSGLVAALFFGCAFTLVVAAMSCRVLCEAWSRRHYSKLRYLDNGGSGF